jgi:DNA-binding NarL/FixJ family response regulator
MTRVLVADDQDLVRHGLRMILELGGVDVVGEASDGAAAVAAAAELRPDVVLMDLRMPVMDGVEATRRITEASGAAVLVITTFDTDQHVVDAIRAGAVGSPAGVGSGCGGGVRSGCGPGWIRGHTRYRRGPRPIRIET